MKNLFQMDVSEVMDMDIMELLRISTNVKEDEWAMAIRWSRAKQRSQKFCPIVWTVLKRFNFARGLQPVIAQKAGASLSAVRAVCKGVYDNDKIANALKEEFMRCMELPF